MANVSYNKDCDCIRATATVGGISLTQREVEDEIVFTATVKEGRPVCDVCGRPWRLAPADAGKGET